MAREDFTYDAQTFVVGEAGGVDVRKLEADYAEMYMEALAKGALAIDDSGAPIDAAARERLDRAADIFGLYRGRLLQIEQAMQADFQARRSPTNEYRTTPLGGLGTRTKGGYYHDGRFATLRAVVEHYDRVFGLRLTETEMNDLVEYLKSL